MHGKWCGTHVSKCTRATQRDLTLAECLLYEEIYQDMSLSLEKSEVIMGQISQQLTRNCNMLLNNGTITRSVSCVRRGKARESSTLQERAVWVAFGENNSNCKASMKCCICVQPQVCHQECLR